MTFRTIAQADPLREMWWSGHLFESCLLCYHLLSQPPLLLGLETVMELWQSGGGTLDFSLHESKLRKQTPEKPFSVRW